MYQKLILVGNLGSDPEMRYLPNGTAVANFNMATSNRYTSDGNKVEETTWWRITVWGKQAENANQYLSKGGKVLVEGQIKPDPETGTPKTFTRNDGSVGTSYEVTAKTIQYLSSFGGTSSGGNQPAPSGKQEQDEIPF